MVFGLRLGRKAPPEVKMRGRAGIVELPFGSGQYNFARDAQSLTKNGFLQNPIVFRSVRMMSEAAAHVKLNLQDENMRYDTHPVLSLIASPNEVETGIEFLENLYTQYLLYGHAFIKAIVDENFTFQALYILRADRMRVILGDDGWPEGYKYTIGSKVTEFDAFAKDVKIIQIKSFHPHDDHYGLTPMVSAAAAIDVHNAASSWSKALLDNAARPSGAIVYRGVEGGGQLSNQQFERLRDEMISNHQGARNAGRPMLLEGGLDWKPMGFSPSDMEFHRTKETAAREIALAFGVPPMLLGIPGDNTYSNYQEANRAFYRGTVLPLVEQIVAKLNNSLLNDQDVSLSVNMESITALSNERESEWRRVCGADFLSDDEKRILLGFPSKENSNA